MNGYKPNLGGNSAPPAQQGQEGTSTSTLDRMQGVGTPEVAPWRHQQSAIQQGQQEADYFTQRLSGGHTPFRTTDYDPMSGLTQELNGFSQASQQWRKGLKQRTQNNDLFGF